MTQIVLLRHGVTDWNRQGRVQGHTDTALPPDTRAFLAAHRLPDAALAAVGADPVWVASPLRRTQETARALGGVPRIAPALIEMSWGAWEGRILAEVRAELGDAFAANEARGLDFQAPEGESPRQVRARVAPWLADVARAGTPLVAVTHAGVLRAILSHVTGWDFMGKPPLGFNKNRVHVLDLAASKFTAINLRLVPR